MRFHTCPKTLSALLALSTALLFGGCAKETGSSPVSSGLESISAVEYEYSQEIVRLDDSYRTYYEVFLYSFYDSDGDGIGDLNGLTQKLDYISDLGFDGIWLMPILESTTYHKYDVVDYHSIDPQYGTLEDFENLAAECDKRGIRLILDMVLNHTSAQNAWFLSATQSLRHPPCGETVCVYDDLCPTHNPYCGYYNFSAEEPAGAGWTAVSGTSYFYECVFWDQMPDLNLENEALRAELESTAKFWLEKGADGFRLDAAKEFYTGSVEKNTEVLRWFTEYCKSVKPDCYLVAEVWDSFTSYTKYYASGIDSVFEFTLADSGGKIAKTLNAAGSANSAQSFGQAVATIDQRVHSQNPQAISAPFIANHDLPRTAGIYSGNSKKIKAAAGMLLTMPGNPFVYYGEELGMSGSGADPNKRAPMLWSADTSAAGMTDGPPEYTPQPHSFPSAEEQQADADSILNYYKRAIRIRNENPEIARGTVTDLPLSDEETCASQREYAGESVYLAYNLSEEPKEITDSVLELSGKKLRGYLTVSANEKVTLQDGVLKLPPYAIAVFTESQ